MLTGNKYVTIKKLTFAIQTQDFNQQSSFLERCLLNNPEFISF